MCLYDRDVQCLHDCGGCVAASYDYCERCGDYHLSNSLTEFMSELLCDNCLADAEEELALEEEYYEDSI